MGVQVNRGITDITNANDLSQLTPQIQYHCPTNCPRICHGATVLAPY